MQKTEKDRLIEFIEFTGMTDEKFASKVGITRQIVSLWKRERAYPSSDKIIKIIKTFPDLDANWLIRGEKIGEESKKHTSFYLAEMAESYEKESMIPMQIFNEVKKNYEDQIAFLRGQIRFLQVQISPDYKEGV